MNDEPYDHGSVENPQTPGTTKSLLIATLGVLAVIGAIAYVGTRADLPTAKTEVESPSNSVTEPGIEWPVVK